MSAAALLGQPLPFQLVITGKPVLVLGSGEAAEAKLRLLKERGAAVEHWQTEPDAQTIARAEQANNNAKTRYVLAIVAERSGWCLEYLEWLERERIPVNVVDLPQHSSGFIPAIVSRGSVQIGIGTGGLSPVLARLLRSRIEQALPQGIDQLAGLASRWQQRVREKLSNVTARRLFWERALTGPAANAAQAGDQQAADQLLASELAATDEQVQGKVSLVGAGPGDPGLLTTRALQLLQSADVVLYDALVSPEILSLARRDAQLEDVGKRRGHCPMPQEAICERLVELGQSGQIICRLKGGDPYLFGRGGEEALALAEAGIACEVVPGITSASAIAAATGMPLTHRKLARSVRFITGHLALNQSDTDWQTLAKRQETLVVYMGFSHALDIANALISGGLSSDTPMAFIQNGTRSNQRVVHAQLGSVADSAAQLKLEDGPILMVIGEVTTLAQTLGRDTDKQNNEEHLSSTSATAPAWPQLAQGGW